MAAVVAMAVGVEASMVAEVAADSTEVAADLRADSTAAATGDIAEAGVDLAGVAVGAAVMVGDAAGAGTAGAVAGAVMAGDAAGVGAIPVGAGGSASALVGAGVPIGEVTRMGMAIPTIPIIRTTHTMGLTHMRQRTRISTTVPTEIRATTRSGKIRAIQDARGRLA
jgi:hypothetical protein